MACAHIQLAVVDEHEVFRRGIVGVLHGDPAIEIVHESDSGQVPTGMDVVIASPGALQSLSTGCPVIVCWGPADPPVVGYRDQSLALVERDTLRCDELLAAVRALAAGLRVEHCNGGIRREALDLRHRHILQLLSEGADTRGIAESLFYSERSVKGMIRQIEEHLCARNRAQAVAKSIRLGLI
jgi:DNA-binding NarL/FixJ family response regulator